MAILMEIFFLVWLNIKSPDKLINKAREEKFLKKVLLNIIDKGPDNFTDEYDNVSLEGFNRCTMKTFLNNGNKELLS